MKDPVNQDLTRKKKNDQKIKKKENDQIQEKKKDTRRDREAENEIIVQNKLLKKMGKI